LAAAGAARRGAAKWAHYTPLQSGVDNALSYALLSVTIVMLKVRTRRRVLCGLVLCCCAAVLPRDAGWCELRCCTAVLCCLSRRPLHPTRVAPPARSGRRGALSIADRKRSC
jgi:hypothetical protein